MGLRISYNEAAQNTHKTLAANDSNLTKSIQRLSTGVRVNSASDDPAGLVISQKLKAQISGLGQAVSNAGDAVNMVKTAEGAMSETSNLLNSMRDLAIHAANTGATDSAAAQADQAQVANAIQSLNKIAGETQFGSRKLLDGSAGIKTFVNGSKVMSGDLSFAQGLTTGADIKISVSQAASQAKVVGKRADGMDATGYSSATYASTTTTLGVAGNIAFTDKSGTTRTVNYGSASTVGDLVNAVNAFGTSTTGITADFSASTGKISMIKTDDAKGTSDVFRWTATGSHATAVSSATFASTTTAIGGEGSITVRKEDGTSATVTWKATDQVSNVISAVNNLGTAQTGITASYNTTTGAIDMNKTGTSTGKTDILSWSSVGSNAASSSTATFGSLASTMSAGSMNLTKADGTSTTISWSTGSTVSQVVSAVNALGTSDSGITASYNATTQKIDLVKTDATTGSSDVLAYTTRGSDAAVSTVATWATGATAFGTTVTGNLTLNLTSGTTAVIALSSVMTSDQLVAAVNALGTANTGITASYNATTGAIDFVKTDDRKGSADVLQLSVSSGSFLSNAAVLSATGVGVDSFSLSTSVAGKDVFSHSFSTTGTEVFAASSTIVGASMDSNSFASSDGSMFINGVQISYLAGDSTNAVIAKINAQSDLSGAVASLNSTSGRIEVNTSAYGSKASLSITNGDLLLGDGTSSATTSGTDAVAQVTKTINGVTTNLSDQNWSKGDGLTIKDTLGNSIVLNTAGGSATSDASSQFTTEVNTLTFQVGAYAGQTRDLNINAMFANNLGNGAVADKNVSNIDLTTAQGAQDAIKVLDKAISDVSSVRANLGATQKNVLESSISSLGVAKENLSASNSTITDTDMAAEMVNYTRYTVLNQAGISMMSQSNSSAQNILSLLR